MKETTSETPVNTTVALVKDAAEEWRPIEGWEGLYWVSNAGRVKSRYTILKPQRNRNGYFYVILHSAGYRKNISIHRLVALAFIPNPENKIEVDHIDCDQSNNYASNLRWCTSSENQNNPITIKRSSDTARRLWNTETHRNKMLEVFNKEERRAKISVANSNPEWIRKMRSATTTPEALSHYYEAMSSAEYKEHARIAHKKQWKPLYCYETKTIYACTREAGEVLGVSKAIVKNACQSSAQGKAICRSVYKGKPVYHCVYLEDLTEEQLELAKAGKLFFSV